MDSPGHPTPYKPEYRDDAAVVLVRNGQRMVQTMRWGERSHRRNLRPMRPAQVARLRYTPTRRAVQ